MNILSLLICVICFNFCVLGSETPDISVVIPENSETLLNKWSALLSRTNNSGLALIRELQETVTYFLDRPFIVASEPRISSRIYVLALESFNMIVKAYKSASNDEILSIHRGVSSYYDLMALFLFSQKEPECVSFFKMAISTIFMYGTDRSFVKLMFEPLEKKNLMEIIKSIGIYFQKACNEFKGKEALIDFYLHYVAILKKRGFLKSIAQAPHPMTSFSFIYANKSQLVDRFASWIEIFAFIIDDVFDGFLEEDPSRIRAFFELSKTINQEEDIDYVISIFSAANVFKFIQSQPEIYNEGIELLTFLKTKFPHRLLLALSWLGDRSSILISDMKMKENTFSNSSNDDNSKSSTSTLSIHDEEIRTRVAFTVHATKLKNFLQISKVDFNVEVISDIKRRLSEFSADKVNLLPVELRESLANLFENKFLAYYEIAYAQAKPLQFLYFPGTFIKVLKYLDCFKSADLREKARRIFDESYANIISKLENRKTHVFLFDISNYFEEFYHHLLDEREFVIKASRIIEIFPANAVIFEIVIGFLKKRGCENNVLSVLNIQREVTQFLNSPSSPSEDEIIMLRALVQVCEKRLKSLSKTELLILERILN